MTARRPRQNGDGSISLAATASPPTCGLRNRMAGEPESGSAARPVKTSTRSGSNFIPGPRPARGRRRSPPSPSTTHHGSPMSSSPTWRRRPTPRTRRSSGSTSCPDTAPSGSTGSRYATYRPGSTGFARPANAAPKARMRPGNQRNDGAAQIGTCCSDTPSARTVSDIRGALRSALSQAVTEDLITRNVAALVKLPTPRSKRGNGMVRRRSPAVPRVRPGRRRSTLRRIRLSPRARSAQGRGTRARLGRCRLGRGRIVRWPSTPARRPAAPAPQDEDGEFGRHALPA